MQASQHAVVLPAPDGLAGQPDRLQDPEPRCPKDRVSTAQLSA
jgi:hypothetical protein